MHEGLKLGQVQDWGQFAPRVHDYLVEAYSGLDKRAESYVKAFRERVEPEIVAYMIQHYIRSAVETGETQELYSAAHLLSQLFKKMSLETAKKEVASHESERNSQTSPSGDRIPAKNGGNHRPGGEEQT